MGRGPGTWASALCRATMDIWRQDAPGGDRETPGNRDAPGDRDTQKTGMHLWDRDTPGDRDAPGSQGRIRGTGTTCWPQGSGCFGNCSGYSTCGNRSVPASGPVTMEQGMGPRRKEYFSQRRYLRSDFHPELDMEDEQQDSENRDGSVLGVGGVRAGTPTGDPTPHLVMLPGSTGMTRQRESPLSTEVRLLDSTSSSLSDRQPEDSLTMMVISSQSGEDSRPPSPR